MTDYEKLKEICNEIDELLLKQVDESSSDFISWKTKTEDFLEMTYGTGSRRFERFEETSFNPVILCNNESNSHYADACADGLKAVKATFQSYLKEMEKDMNNKSSSINASKNDIVDFSDVFVVHGHDGETREAVARLLERQKINPIILSDEVNCGATIIEKIEKYSNVNAAICIFSPDDIGRSKKETNEHCRARQNVVLETGYFMGKLGRKKVIILYKGKLELPSDLQGICYTNSEWKIKILKELREIGYTVDLNLI